MRATLLLWILPLALGCQSPSEPSAPAKASMPTQPASVVEALLRDRDRPREKLNHKQLQGAWSVFKSSGRQASALSGDHPVVLVREAPDLALGNLIFLGSIEVAMGVGREGFEWDTAKAHLKGRAQEHGADLVLLAKVEKDPVGKGLRRVLAAAYRYVGQEIR